MNQTTPETDGRASCAHPYLASVAVSAEERARILAEYPTPADFERVVHVELGHNGQA